MNLRNAKESYHMAKETYFLSKETYHMAKETYFLSKETHHVSRERVYASVRVSERSVIYMHELSLLTSHVFFDKR